MSKYRMSGIILSSIFLTGLAVTGFASPVKNTNSHNTSPKTPSKSVLNKFSTVSIARTKSAISSNDLKSATKLIGKKGSFVGVVNNIYMPKIGQEMIYLNFAKSWKTTISAAIPSTLEKSFPSLSTLVGKTVMITGKFSQYDNTHPEIIVTSSKQIELVVK